MTLSEAGAERSGATPAQRAKFAAYVHRVNERFFKRSGWNPSRIKNVAGALAYTRYNLLLRLIMKRFASKSGG